MRNLFVRIVVALVLGLVATPTSAQDLPNGDSRNGGFREHFEKVKRANLFVVDFQKMQPGAVYNLPDGTTDELRVGDKNGIWGREFQKWYNMPYNYFF